jgi:hypothetical protein
LKRAIWPLILFCYQAPIANPFLRGAENRRYERGAARKEI